MELSELLLVPDELLELLVAELLELELDELELDELELLELENSDRLLELLVAELLELELTELAELMLLGLDHDELLSLLCEELELELD